MSKNLTAKRASTPPGRLADTPLAKAVSIVRSDGVLRGMRQIAARAAGHIYRSERFLVTEKDLSNTTGAARVSIGSVEVREGQPHEIVEFVSSHFSPRQRRKVESYLDHGYHCFLGFVEGVPIGHYWWVDGASSRTAPAHPALDRLGIDLDPDSVYGFDFVIAPPYRRKGVAESYLGAVESNLAERGYQRVFGFVDASNTPALWLYRLHGHKIVRSIRGREFLNTILVSGGRVYLRNPGWSSQAFDARPIRLRPRST